MRLRESLLHESVDFALLAVKQGHSISNFDQIDSTCAVFHFLFERLINSSTLNYDLLLKLLRTFMAKTQDCDFAGKDLYAIKGKRTLSVLQYLIKSKRNDVVARLAKDLPEFIEHYGRDDATFVQCLSYGPIEASQLLLQSRPLACVSNVLTQTPVHGHALLVSAASESSELFAHCLEKSTDVKLETLRDSDGNSFLHYGAIRGHEYIRQLVQTATTSEFKALMKPNKTTLRTPFHEHVAHGHSHVVRAMLKRAPKLSSIADGLQFMPWEIALFCSHYELASSLNPSLKFDGNSSYYQFYKSTLVLCKNERALQALLQEPDEIVVREIYLLLGDKCLDIVNSFIEQTGASLGERFLNQMRKPNPTKTVAGEFLSALPKIAAANRVPEAAVKLYSLRSTKLKKFKAKSSMLNLTKYYSQKLSQDCSR